MFPILDLVIVPEKDGPYAYASQTKWGRGWAAGRVTGAPALKGHENSTERERRTVSHLSEPHPGWRQNCNGGNAMIVLHGGGGCRLRRHAEQ